MQHRESEGLLGPSEGHGHARVKSEPRRVGEHWVAFDGMTWPLPDPDLDWRLRYGGTVSRTDALHAASIVSAYQAMVSDNREKRARVIQAIRQVARETL